MSRYESASHVFYLCQYHLVWTPKYRYKILKGDPGNELCHSIYIYCSMKEYTVVELNVQIDHIYQVVRTPPSLNVSELIRFVKGRTAIRPFAKFHYLRKHKLWSNHFWQREYFVDSVGANEEIILRYVRYQDKVAEEEEEEERQIQPGLEGLCLSPTLEVSVKATCYAEFFTGHISDNSSE
ncbi:IS200/IS605 family transposase [Salmonella enterica]|nr:IS200/IS605 family transposase [Salmonella enterica]EEJ9028842.1 IS200/IS605 family transposase [Salmonella enterica subsp. enterica]ELC5052861.1 IS200/IS605 family transposase [Salmonella enterica]